MIPGPLAAAAGVPEPGALAVLLVALFTVAVVRVM